MDVAIYETFARMSQKWINNLPEVDWHGANGNQIIGNAPANQRYTEARLSKATEEGMFQGIKKHNVPMVLNFSEDEEWPEVLPAIFPRLLVNGSQGIGVTIANTWLCHNLKEISNIILQYLKGEPIDYTKIYPDFPTGGTIINMNNLSDIYKTGKGKVILRATTEIKNNKILITELPYQVFIEPLIDSIKDLINKNELKGIKDIFNKSDKKRLLIEIDCDGEPSSILAELFAKTSLQSNYNANQVALVGKTPTMLNLEKYIDIYIDHNLKCIVRECQFDLEKAKARLEIVEGLLKALLHIDEIITLIKKSDSSKAAVTNLQATYDFSENQAKAIVAMKLGSLAKLEAIELNNEKNKLNSTISELNNILQHREEQVAILTTRLTSFAQKYGTERRTKLTQLTFDSKKKIVPEIIEEEVVVTIDQDGGIKRTPKSSFKIQKRNGKGVKNSGQTPALISKGSTTNYLSLFSSKGKMYRILINNIPADRPCSLSDLIKIEYGEKILYSTVLDNSINKEFAIFVTKNGLIKKTLLSEYKSITRNSGIQAIKLKEGDSIVNVSFCTDEDLVLFSNMGKCLHVKSIDIKPIGRVTSGQKGMKLDDGDYITNAVAVSKIDSMFIIAENGLGKFCSLEDFPLHKTNTKGVIIKPEKIIKVIPATRFDTVMIVGNTNTICVELADIATLNRTCQGVHMIKDTKVINAVKI